MFLCYADESGFSGGKYDANQPVQTMAAIFPNVYNYHRSDAEFKDVFKLTEKYATSPVLELKGKQIYRGEGAWKAVPPKIRDEVIGFYLNWIASRNHKLVVTAIDNKAYFDLRDREPHNPFLLSMPCPYLLAGLHIALMMQKLHRGHDKNKGKTVLIFDEQSEFEDQLANLIFNPPDFTDDFVEYDEKKENCRLCQIIDTAFFRRFL